MSTGNPYAQYYVNQAGTGIGSFEGIRFQRGNGFFGSIFKNTALPLLSYLGKQFLRTGVDVAGDVINGEPIKEALKIRSKRKLRDIAGDAARRASVFEQTGRGNKRRRHSKKNRKVTTTPRKPKRKNKPARKIKPNNFSLF
jgi:hypothetical protein